MTPVVLLAGVVILVVMGLFGLYSLGHKGHGSRRLRMKVTMVPPSLEFYIEHRSD